MIKTISSLNKIYLSLILILTIFTGISVFYLGDLFPTEIIKNSPPKIITAFIQSSITLVVYGELCYIGLILSNQLNISDILDKKVSNKQ